MNIILRELKSNRKALIIWCVSVFLFTLMGMAKYSGFATMGDEVNAMLDSLPKAMSAMFGLSGVNLTEMKGYYSIFYIYFALIAGIHAIMLGATIISKEERDKTADFLMVKPVKRHHVITSKLIASVINVVIVNLAILVSSIPLAAMFNKGESATSYIIIVSGLLLVIQLVFLAIGLFISSITQTTKKATGLSTGLILGMYMISLAIPLSDKLNFLRFTTPFYYFDAKVPILNQTFDGMYFLLSGVIIVVCVVLTYIFFNKKDIHS